MNFENRKVSQQGVINLPSKEQKLAKAMKEFRFLLQTRKIQKLEDKRQRRS